MRVCGIDPGLEGGIAFADILPGVSEYRNVSVYALPGHYRGEKVGRAARVAWPGPKFPLATDLAKIIADNKPTVFIVENPSPGGRMGLKQARTLFCGLGATLAICQVAKGIEPGSIHVVHPAVWQAAFGRGADKPLSIATAHALFPTAVFDGDGPAEALLFIEYFRRFVLPDLPKGRK